MSPQESKTFKRSYTSLGLCSIGDGHWWRRPYILFCSMHAAQQPLFFSACLFVFWCVGTSVWVFLGTCNLGSHESTRFNLLPYRLQPLHGGSGEILRGTMHSQKYEAGQNFHGQLFPGFVLGQGCGGARSHSFQHAGSSLCSSRWWLV